ncbi:hypothetical protein B0H13DRAFT_41217 [Mycena leptocephala]|nr:hypothetical protein B0H13DRAFT_41217 [Mycena leptocephala]
MKYILDTINGANDTSRDAPPPVVLRPSPKPTSPLPSLIRRPSDPFRPDWHRLHIWPCKLLKRWLKHNSEFSGSLTVSVVRHEGGNRCGMGPWITTTFDGPRVAPEWDSWTTALSYCQPCLVKFLEEHVWRWFLDERVKGGWLPPENCSYGYKCPAIVHKLYHAKNHLCVPIVEPD